MCPVIDMTEPTNRPDLPDIDEDDGPKTGKLVMSREVRGWMAGLAAVLVAVAAIAPSVDFGELTGALVDKNSLNVPLGEGDSCTAEDQSGGMGGQSVRCSFNCPSDPGTVSVSVDADDNDAHVSGTADCGGDSAHCSGKNTCSDTETRRASGAGSCSADSDEAFDSGLYVECSAGIDGATEGIPGPGSDICPTSDPVTICIQPVCHHFAGRTAKGGIDLKDQCMTIWQTLAKVVNENSNVIGYWTDGIGLTGLNCKGYVCTPLELN